MTRGVLSILASLLVFSSFYVSAFTIPSIKSTAAHRKTNLTMLRLNSCANSLVRTYHSRLTTLSSKRSLSNNNQSRKSDGRSTFLFKKSSTEFRMTSSEENESSKKETLSTTKTLDSNNPFRNKNNIDDQIFAAISGNGEMKVTATTIRNLVNDVMIQQTLTPTPADSLARSMSCGLLLSNGMQLEQTFQLTLACDGPIRNVVSISNGKGEVRGYVGNPGLGDMHIAEAIGRGTVQVVKNHPEWSNPYNGITAIEHGDVDRDVGIYLAESEQRSCALAASSKFNGLLCIAAGGYVVEQLPNCTPETVAQVEKNLAKIIELNGADQPVPAGLLVDGKTPYDICEIILDGLDMKPLQQVTPQLVCECNEERLFRAVRLLPMEEVDKILLDQEQIEARCHFCGKVYRIGPGEVRERLAAAKGDPALDADFGSEQNSNN